MTLVDLINHWGVDLDQVADLVDFTFDRLTPVGKILAQKVENPDIIGQMTKAWQSFIKSGQGWALLIGLFFGYIFKSFTSY